jgi:hypothetical protein
MENLILDMDLSSCGGITPNVRECSICWYWVSREAGNGKGAFDVPIPVFWEDCYKSDLLFLVVKKVCCVDCLHTD